jgi:hypothetical protein
MDVQSNAKMDIMERIRSDPLPEGMRGFGDWDTFIGVLRLAAKIVGESPAPTKKLNSVLLLLSVNFLDLKERVQGRPGQPELRGRLHLMSDWARQMRNELEDFEILSKLVAAERSDQRTCDAMAVETRRRALDELTYIAAAAAAKIPKGKGTKRDKANDIAAQELCAFMMRRAWYVARGEWPGPQSVRAWEACEALWIAAGGSVSEEGNPAPERWRRHLENAARPRAQGSNGAAFVRDGNGRVRLVQAVISSPSTFDR